MKPAAPTGRPRSHLYKKKSGKINARWRETNLRVIHRSGAEEAIVLCSTDHTELELRSRDDVIITIGGSSGTVVQNLTIRQTWFVRYG